MKKILINTELVKNQTKGTASDVKALAFFIKAKLLFGNSTVYRINNSSRKLAQLFGCSHNVVKKYLSELDNLGLLRVTGRGNVTFVSLKKSTWYLQQNTQTKVWFEKTDSLQTIASKLLFSVLKKNCENQKFLIELKADKINATANERHVRKYLNHLSVKSQNTITKQFVLTNEKLGKLLNCSPQQASVLKNKWRELNLCNFFSGRKCLGKVSAKRYEVNKDLFGKKCFVANGWLWEVKPSHIKFTGSYSYMNELAVGCIK